MSQEIKWCVDTKQTTIIDGYSYLITEEMSNNITKSIDNESTYYKSRIKRPFIF